MAAKARADAQAGTIRDMQQALLDLTSKFDQLTTAVVSAKQHEATTRPVRRSRATDTGGTRRERPTSPDSPCRHASFRVSRRPARPRTPDSSSDEPAAAAARPSSDSDDEPRQHRSTSHRLGTGRCSTPHRRPSPYYGSRQNELLQGKYLQPYRIITRGDNCAKIKSGEATTSEYFDALYRLANHKDLPRHMRQPILDHQAELITMTLTWTWHVCRQWSERVFMHIADGRLPRGWEGRTAIKNMQLEAMGAGKSLADVAQTRQWSAPRQAAPSAAAGAPEYSRSYDKDVHGRICKIWNKGKECGYQQSHGTMPDRLAHYCGWCANMYHKANPHQEYDCNSKKRALAKNAAQNPTDF